MHRFMPLFFFCLLAVLIALALINAKEGRVIQSALLNEPVPITYLPAAVPETIGFSSDALKGAPSMVSFFASWCVPCRAEMYVLTAAVKEDGVRLYGIAYKDKPAALQEWLTSLGNPFLAIGADRQGRVALNWGVTGVPETFVIDGKGIIRYKHVGPITVDVYKNILKPLLAELKS